MKSDLESYLHTQFSNFFPTQPKIQCDNGWFFLILWTCRFLDSYKREFDRINHPQILENAEILQIKNENGLLKIICNNIKQKQQSFIDTIYFLSGFVCEKSGRFYNNVLDLEKRKTINISFLDETSTNKYIDNERLRNLINENFKEIQ